MPAPLSVPVTTGLEATTRMRYWVPGGIPAGMVAEIVPEAVPFSVPMATGLAKLPATLESCAVNTLPEPKLQAENGTATVLPPVSVVGETAPVAILAEREGGPLLIFTIL